MAQVEYLSRITKCVSRLCLWVLRSNVRHLSGPPLVIDSEFVVSFSQARSRDALIARIRVSTFTCF